MAETYSELKAEITTYLSRGTDLDSLRDKFIANAEAFFNRKLRVRQMEEEASLSTDENGDANLPSDFLAARSVRRVGSPNIELRPISMGGENRLSPYDTAGIPRWYSISGSTLRVTPIEQGTLTLTYYEKIPALSDSQTTNWLLTLAPDVYLYRCLSEAHIFDRDFDAALGFQQQADIRIAELEGLDDHARYHNAGIEYDGAVA